MSRVLVYAGAVLVLLAALALSTGGMQGALFAVALIVACIVLVALGPERVGILALGAAFATAPMYKRLAPAGSAITPTDLALVLGFALLLPRMLRNRFDLPVQYVLAGGVIFATGLIGSFASDQTAAALLALAFWMATMFFLLVGVHLWRPTPAEIKLMAWLFVGGQAFSLVYGMATGASYGGRFYGMTIHPNYFAEAGLLCFALLLHISTVTTPQRKWLVWAAMGLSVYTIFLSGSRAGFLGLAAILALMPVVERSALRVYALALGAAGAALYVSHDTALLDKGPIGRLLGHGTASGSNAVRTQGLNYGWHRFTDHPLSGTGLVDLLEVHNNYLEVAIGVGIFGFVAFLVVLYTLVRPLLFSLHPLRRLCYPVFAYAVFGATTPSLYDRTFWVGMCLCIVAVVAEKESRRAGPAVDALPEPPPARPRLTLVGAAPDHLGGPR
ncbi:O-antigen ligase family protein [Nocardioides pocheonensis]|uniref:O-antigen ligase domain-containing protein n=1 Tax=Nocardioides pocheonensis TaxID=661485 RepID=A0A3N0GXU7_9ACTN|nr:O-antigen ligase family protein [Nocardioides pocheonensis]RNM17293.1 O-antigen ligase domain-containing protein [Nocardioides pocheonensis]